MRKPALNLCLWLGLLAVGAALLWAGNAASGLVAGVLLVPGAGLVGCAPFFIARAALATIGYARFTAGRGSLRAGASRRRNGNSSAATTPSGAARARHSSTSCTSHRYRAVGIDVIVVCAT